MRYKQPIDDKIFNWDPENMDQYWLLCERFDRYPDIESAACESANNHLNSRGRKSIGKI